MVDGSGAGAGAGVVLGVGFGVGFRVGVGEFGTCVRDQTMQRAFCSTPSCEHH